MDVRSSGELILAVDSQNNRAYLALKGTQVSLTPTETRLMLYLCEHSDRILPYRKILHDVWGRHYVPSNLSYSVSILRKKMRELGAANQIITNKFSGYMYSPSA